MADNFVINNGILEAYRGSSKTVKLPTNVTRIGKKAFANSLIQSVTFEGNGLKSIDEEAFSNCTSLTSILIPNGVIQIGSRAFYGCSSLEYAAIPDSLMVTGEQIFGNCSKNLLIIGNDKGEAGIIAKHFGLVLKTDLTKTLCAHNKAKATRAALETKTFDILGETVTCSNTLTKYHENIEFYSRKKDYLLQNFISQFPPNLFGLSGDFAAVFDVEIESLVTRLNEQGVFIRKKDIENGVIAPYRAITEVVAAVLKVYQTIASDVNNGISNNRRDLINEAESKITGLDFGIIGDGLDMIAYSIDDYRARSEQRERTYAEANRKFEETSQRYTNQGNQLYIDFFRKITPALRQCTDKFLDTLCSIENEQLMKAGMIDSKDIGRIDIPKSVQLVESITDSPEDNSFTVALAIKKYPCNIAALVYACEHKYSCKGLQELISFLGLQDKIDSGIKESKAARYFKLESKIDSVSSGNQGVAIIKEYEKLLDESEIKQLLHRLSKMVTPMVENLLPENLDTIVDTDAYWTNLLSQVINVHSWNFFVKYGILPIQSAKRMPESATFDYSKMVVCLSEKVKKEKITEDKYAEYLRAYPEVKDLEANKKRIKEVRDLCADYYENLKFYYYIWSAIALGCFGFVMLYLVMEIFWDQDALGFWVFGSWIVACCLWIAANKKKENGKVKYKFEYVWEKYRAAKKEEKALAKQIMKAQSSPRFEE